jgi:hypothetical protein
VRRFLLVCGISLFLAAGASAQIHPATSAIMSDSPDLAPPLPTGNANGDGTILVTAFSGPTRFEASVEYNWAHMNEYPGNHFNLNGFVGSLTWFINRQIGIEGQELGGWGNTSGYTAKLAFAGGGVHARFNLASRFTPYVHVLVGHAHILPQTPYGGQGAFGWEVGGGADYRVRSWMSLRAGADAFGTRFFGSDQVSPIVHAGFVFNF